MKTAIISALCFMLLISNKSHSQSCASHCPTFNGQNSYISLANSNSEIGPSGSFEAWIYPTNTSAAYNIIFIQDLDGGTCQSGFFLYNNGQLYLQNWQGSDFFRLASNTTLNDNTWYHVAGTWETTGGSVSSANIYINGRLDASYEGTGGTTTGGTGSSTGTGYTWNNNGQSPVCIGGWDHAIAIHYPTYYYSFYGDIDEARIWNYSRSQCEIIENMEQLDFFGTGFSGLLSYHQFSESTIPGTTSDVTGNSYDGTLNNISTWGASSAPVISNNTYYSSCSPAFNDPYCIENNGTNSYLVAANSNAWMGASGSFEAWIYPTNVSANYNIIFIQDLDGGTSQSGFFLFNNGQLYLQNWQGLSFFRLVSQTSLSNNNWYHVAGTWETTGGSISSAKIYINGCLDASYEIGTTVGGSTSSTGTGYTWNNNGLSPLCIGGWDQATAIHYPSSYYSFYGKIDEAKVWSASISQEQVIAGMYNSISGTPANLLAYYPFDNNTVNTVDLNSATAYNSPSPAFTSTNVPKINPYCSMGCKPYVTGISAHQTSSDDLLFFYPNPSSNETVLNVGGVKNEDVVIQLYDITGKAVKTLYKGSLSGIDKNIVLNTSDLPEGIYECVHSSNSGIKQCRLVVAR